MADFETAIKYVIDNEGGDSNDAADNGGRTRFGITQNEAKNHGYDVTKLTIDQAKDIYRKNYWYFDNIIDQRVATKLLDMSVNLGIQTAIILVQTIVRVKNIDGIIGPDTTKAINLLRPDFLLFKLTQSCVNRYVKIVVKDITQIVFLQGWINRAFKLP